ncbi:MAG: thiol peroxidase [Bacteroidia bacterium]|nr:thiol peroxidase [Bacteroidia bacterium]
MANSIKIGDKNIKIAGGIPQVGEEAPDITFVKNDLTEISLYDINEPVKVILGIPSIDTGVCQTETRKFNELMSEFEGVKTLIISRDLPFAQKRFCGAEGIANVELGSDYRYNDFNQDFGVEIMEGSMKGLSARCAFVVDSKFVIRYSELVPSIGMEPDYDAILKVVEKYLKK